MSFIEHLNKPGWQDFFANIFEYTLHVLQNDRFRQMGSAGDDLRGLLTAAGIPGLKTYLNEAMERQRYSEAYRTEVMAYLEQLVQQHRRVLLDLTASATLPTTLEHTLTVIGAREEELAEWFTRLQAGERPFEEWMRHHGHSEQEIAAIYQIIDQWLIDHGLIRPPKPSAHQSVH